MATANDLITRAYRRGRILGKDQVPSADEAADALAELNNLLDEWWNERLAVFHVLQENFPLVAGQASRTIGAGGNFATTRPLRLLDGCFVRRAGVDSPVAVLEDRASYDGIRLKSASGQPEFVFYDAAVPLGTLYFWPTPDQGDTLFLNSPARLQSVATLVTQLALPPGYDRLVVNGLAIALCPEHGLEAPASVKSAFSQTKRVLKRTNAPAPVMSFDASLLPRSAGYDINIE
jgi:hypothetical protein